MALSEAGVFFKHIMWLLFDIRSSGDQSILGPVCDLNAHVDERVRRGVTDTKFTSS